MEIKTLFDFDELNRIYASTQGSEYDMQKMLEASYMLGSMFAYENLVGREPTEDEIDDLVDLSLLNDTVWAETAGKNFAQRLTEYQGESEGENQVSKSESSSSSTSESSNKGSSEGKKSSEGNSSYSLPYNIQRLLETEYHRIFDTACHDMAETMEKKTGRKVYKTWQTQKDDRVRDSHVYLQGQTVGLDEEFYTYDGKHALYPSGFNDPEEDVNCRCYLSYSFNGEDNK